MRHLLFDVTRVRLHIQRETTIGASCGLRRYPKPELSAQIELETIDGKGLGDFV
jgi:hypothetical protein